ncbi:transcriptional regulator, GntR family [Sphingobium sp. AP50]|uniref:FadR/GntR family transcriptional regulator n=1 Tax=Sphingobium sp. AP50 TaxID=1884369 RepID=UPI0008B2B466|nr:FadR/GntR family transcriptional regulator [Sphingobium sp. AP50]SEJ23918.1 transcriptional regulator, GntR family [Sphingobium sp. AP50]
MTGMDGQRFQAEGGGIAPLMTGRLHHAVAQRIAIQIVSGTLPVGHVFAAEVDHAETLGISRSVLREAFRILTAKGLVSSKPKAGTKVNERRKWSMLDPDVLAWQIQSAPTEEFLRDLFELRMMVEPQAAEMAALRRNDGQLVDMANALDAMERYTLATEKGRAADQRFHGLLMEAACNEMLYALSSSIMSAIAWTTATKQRVQESPRDPMPEHRALYREIAAQNPRQAQKAMRTLIELALADMQIALRR